MNKKGQPRRQYKPRDYGRKEGRERGNPLVCIMSEDSQSSINYLEEFKHQVGIPRDAIIVVHSSRGTNPINVVDSVIDETKDHQISSEYGIEFDEYWALIDVDHHDHLTESLQKARDNSINIAISSRCFEYWLLLHIRCTTKDFSCSDEIRRELELARKGEKYHKGTEDFTYYFENDRLCTAINNAINIEKSLKYSWRTARRPPGAYTNMHILALRILNHTAARGMSCAECDKDRCKLLKYYNEIIKSKIYTNWFK